MRRECARGDHCADVSSFAAGFLERNGRVQFICQTDWNRLDIYDAQTGECLTEREVYCKEIKESYTDENGKWIRPEYDEKNYFDFFHSLIQVSPGQKRFVSNGWFWAPQGKMAFFDTEEFFETFECGNRLC
jgi:hypothetical protein